MKVTIFQNFTQVIAQQKISEVLDQIKSGKYSKQVASLQKLVKSGNLDEYNEKKKSLIAFTPCGTFVGGRKPQYFKEYSGLVILDYDKLTENHLSILCDRVPLIPYTFAFFKSPSGNGCKILVPITPPLQGGASGVGAIQKHHLLAFNQVRIHYENALSLKVDTSGKDLTRLCFFSSDPDLYYNPEAPVFSVVTQSEVEGQSDDISPRPEGRGGEGASLIDQIEDITRQLESHHIDITTPYENWLKIGFALIDALGAGARDYFHRVSRMNPEYVFTKCEKQFDNCLNRHDSGITIKTFFGFAKDHGIKCTDVPSARLTHAKHPRNTALTPASDSPLSPSSVDSPQPSDWGSEEVQEDPITGKSSKDDPSGRLRKAEGRTNKFHLVRDYLEEHYDIRYNIVSTNFEYREKGEDEFQPMNENNIYIKMCMDGLFMSINNLMAFLKSDIVPSYNPFIQYFESLPQWDGKTDHIKKLSEYVILKADLWDRFDKHFKKWLVRVVKCALVDSYFNKQAFILVHDKQNSGKSTFCRFLCPPALSNHIAENLSIDKDSRILLTTNLLINLDELSTLSKIEINSLKSLFSKDKINDRLPYDRKNSIIPRRASFIGSTNQAEFLNDESGSVRWLCFVIEKIEWSYKQKINIDEVWAQAYALFKSGFECDLTPEEIKENDEYNRQFQITTSEFELIHKYLAPAAKESHDTFMSATDILIYLAEQTDNKVKLNTNNVGKALKMLSFARDKKYPERNYGYYVFKKMV